MVIDPSGVVATLLILALVAAGVRVIVRSARSTPSKYEFDHYVPGLVIVAGAIAITAGVLLPWLELTSRVSVGGQILKFVHAEVRPHETVGAFDLHGDARPLLPITAATAGLALLFAVGLMATHRARGLVWRFFTLGCGASSAAIGAYFLAFPKAEADNVFQAVGKVLVSVTPGTGAYLLVLGGLVIMVGAIVPGRRRPGPLAAAQSALG